MASFPQRSLVIGSASFNANMLFLQLSMRLFDHWSEVGILALHCMDGQLSDSALLTILALTVCRSERWVSLISHLIREQDSVL